MQTVKSKYQASIFLDADSVMPNTKDVTGLIQTLKDNNLLPFLAQEDSTARMGFRSLDNQRRLLLLSKRFIYENLCLAPLENDIGDIETFCKEAESKLGGVLSYFGRKCYRMALVQDIVYFEISQDKLNDIAMRCLNMPRTFSDNLPFEWDWRCTSSIKQMIGSCQEDTNTIAIVNKRMGTIVKTEEDTEEASPVEEQLDSLKVTLDINTSHSNSTVRFGTEELKAFLGQAFNRHNALIKELSDFMFKEK